MLHGFENVQKTGISKAIIIGSDCYELSSEIIENGFLQLEKVEGIIGLALDGGYYALGLNFDKIGNKKEALLASLFKNKNWSHDDVGAEAIAAFEANQMKVAFMPTLSDIDNESDLKGDLLKIIT